MLLSTTILNVIPGGKQEYYIHHETITKINGVYFIQDVKHLVNVCTHMYMQNNTSYKEGNKVSENVFYCWMYGTLSKDNIV